MMRNNRWVKAAGKLLIAIAALALPLSAAHSADAVLRDAHKAVSPVAGTERQAASRPDGDPAARSNEHVGAPGVRGPLRTDPLDASAGRGASLLRRDLETGLYPMANGVGIP